MFSFMHAGTGIWSNQYRGTNSLTSLGVNFKYDFNFQSFITYPSKTEYRVLKKGDSIMTTCVYDTTLRSSITRGGEGSQDEMCLNFLLYYPKPAVVLRDSGLGWCLTSVSPLSTAEIEKNKEKVIVQQ